VKLSDEVREYFRKVGAEGGKKAASHMTKEQRRERGRKAAATRWNKPRSISRPSEPATPATQL